MSTAIRRILVVVDATAAGRETVRTAAAVAAALRAELQGVFLEDEDLLRLARLPFVRELRALPHREEAVNLTRMQRELRALAREAERLMETVATPLQVNWSFRVLRGRLEAALLEAATDTDLLTLALRASQAVGSRLIPTQVISRAPRSVLVSYPGLPWQRGVCAVYDGSPGASKTLATAADIARAQDVPVTVLIASGGDAAMEDEQAVLQVLAERGATGQIERVAAPDIQGLVRAARHVTGTLVVRADHPFLHGAGLDLLLDAVRCPVLFVR